MYQPEKLKARRKELKMAQLDLANKLGISIPAVSNWESDVKEPSVEKVALLEKLLNVPKDYFTEIDIVRYCNTLSPENKEKATHYVKALAESEHRKIDSIIEKRIAYRVYEKMSAGIGTSVYDDRNYDTVYFNEELAHDGAIYAVVCNNQTYIKRVYREEEGLRLVSINTKYKEIFISYDENPRVVGIIVGNFMPLREGRRNG